MNIKTARELGMRLREAREAQGLTQAELGARIGASRYWVLQVEDGKPGASVGLVLRAISELGLECDVRPRTPEEADAESSSLSDILDRARQPRA